MTTGSDEPQGLDELREDIEQTRAELSDTLTELTARVNIPARAKEQVRNAVGAAADTAAKVKNRAPKPVQQVLDRTGGTVGPVVSKANRTARPYRKQIMVGMVVTAVIMWIIRRRRSRS